MEGTRIKFVDAYVRRRQAAVLVVALSVVAAMCLAAAWMAPNDTSRPLLVACVGAAMLIAFIAARVILKHQAKTLGLYIQSKALVLSLGGESLLPFYYNYDGDPLLVIHIRGRQYEITSGSQHRMIRIPMAAIPSLPQILIHYKLDVKLVEPA